MISDNRYLFRAPLLDARQQVIGYKLGRQKNELNGDTQDETDSHALLALFAEHAGDIKSGLFFLDANPAALFAEALQAISPERVVLILKPRDLVGAANVTLTASLRERGFGLALRDVDLAFLNAKDNQPLLSHFSHLLVGFDHPELAEISSLARQYQPAFRLVVDKVPGWQELEACVVGNTLGVFENLCLAPRDMKSSFKIGPQAHQILQLMHMVQGDADIRSLEKVLKGDVTLSYKLLRYINSAGFGLRVEIESPRDAVAMLGYAPLFRWLMLLLARSHTTGFSPALMQASMVRGRFAELLGQVFLSKQEAENLFAVGMCSFLDRLLGIPIQDVLGQMMLPEAVEEALIAREGVYAPVLALTEACEQEDGQTVEVLANALSLTAEQVNQAHLLALAWAQNIKT